MKLGLVLEGGGVKGAFEAGVLKVLDDNGIKFGGVTGTSIGAVNGALYAQDGGMDSLFDVWREMADGKALKDYNKLVEPIMNHEITLDSVIYAGKKMIKLRTFLGDTARRAEKFFRQYVDERKLRASDIRYGLVTYNLSSLLPIEVMSEDIPEGQLVDFIVASATYPLFPPKQIDGKRYVDGGVYDRMPVRLLADQGFDKIVVVRTNLPKKRERHAGINVDDNVRVSYVLPPQDLGWAMMFSSENTRRLYELGVSAALEQLDEIGRFILQ